MKSYRPQVLLLFGSLLLVMLGFGIVIPLLPFVAREMGASSLDMGLLVSVWAAAQFLVSPRWGTFSDRAGRRPAMILGLLGFGLAFILMGVSTQLWMLYAARIIGGLLSASTMPSAKAYAADITPREHRGASMGLLGAAFGLGFMLGPAIGGLMAPLGVRFTFFVAGAGGLITAVFVYFLLPEPEVRTASTSGVSAVAAIIQAVQKPYAMLYWTPFLMTFAGSSLFSMMGFFLMDKFAATESQVGAAFTVNGAMGVLTQGVLITLAIRMFGEVRLLRLSMALSAVGFLMYTFAPSMPVVYACIAFIGLGMGLGRPVMTSLLSNATDMGQGITMGMQTSFDSLGRTLGPLWAGLLYNLSIEAPYLSSALVFVAGVVYLESRRQVLMQAEVVYPTPAGGHAPVPSHHDGTPEN